ncbi:uncharacterized protein E6C27_scaffold824G001020 [Cucumis melo var. makuwa]|uniref:Uncharacterized protein n=1 Tax=Cucumis melo var. makuwa TaxID=1194695 RepID=A0A5A7TLI6_CUCMM|nr:uncharacterized protein E6C27_scaffold824G001020 [Cucumis melo var. makuwa]
MTTNKQHPGLYRVGTPKDLYVMLFAFSDALIRNNPGTYTAEEADDKGRFKFYFMGLAASIDAWNSYVPVISVDGAAIKNKYLGTLIYTCTIDGNSQIVPLAFVVVDSRNLNLHLYTDKFYYVSNLINLYKKGTRPIGSVNQIRNTHQGGNDGILPP